MAVLVSLVVALGLGLAFAALRGMGTRRPVGDEVTYMEDAARSDPYAPGLFLRMPFMAWLAALCRTPAGEGRLRALMALVSVLTVVVTTIAGWHLGGALVAGLAALLLLFQPERIVLACHIWPDGLLALMAAAVALLLLLPSVSGAFLFLALGLACALGSLVRIDFLVVLPVVWVSLEATGRPVDVAGAVLLAAPTLAVVVGWTVHNARSYGLFVPDDTWTFNLMVAEAQLARRGSASFDPEAVLTETLHHWTAVPIGQRPHRAIRSLAALLGSPGRFLSDVARRAVALCGPDTFIRQNLLPHGYPELSASWRRGLEWPLRFAFPLLIALAALGVLLSRVPAASAYAWPSLGLMGVAALFFARTRFRVALLPAFSLLAAQGVVAAASWVSSAPAASSPPWEVWHDLHRLAEIAPGGEVLLRSSYCPSGCRYDRHSAGDWRYLRLDGDEGVIFEEEGAGALTRIWMTTGMGVSRPLPASVRLRVYLDGAASPVLDLPLPALFDGSTPPFVPPLVGDRLTSSGGNFSYVPIPYRDGCRITLLGAHEETLWFQLTYHRLAEPDGVRTFTGGEDLSAWAELLSRRGTDPWPPSPEASTLAGEAELPAGGSVTLAELDGPDSVTALRLHLPPGGTEGGLHSPLGGTEGSEGRGVELRLTFDGEERVRMPLADFFAAGARAGAVPIRSLLVGTDADGWLYAYFPMPFFERALVVLADGGSAPLTVAYELRLAGRAPSSASGLFGARLRFDEETSAGIDIPLLNLSGAGKWVGFFAELGSVGTSWRDYLEGDEHVFVDGSPEPALHGTGTEDFFNGGFYFDQGSFQQALHGSPYHLTPGGEDVTAAYRLMLTDAPTFRRGIRAGLEGGPTGELRLRSRSVAYFYLRSETPLFADGFESGTLASWSPF